MSTHIGFTHRSGATVHTVPAAFQQTAVLRPHQVALRTVGGTQQITWREYAQRVRAIAAGLAKLGVRHGDTVGLMLTNRPEFNLVDTAVLHLGGTPFSVYNTSSPEQIAHVFGNAGNRVVVTEQAFLTAVRGSGVPLEHLVLVDGPATAEVVSLHDLEEDPADGFDFDAAWQAVRPEDLATLIYTSGTTGPSKGVEITHANIIAQVAAQQRDIMRAGFDDRGVSYLPAAHVADRISGHCTNLLTGMTITCVPDAREIAAALPDARPTTFFGVPRVWQKIKAGIEARLAEAGPVQQALAQWAIGAGTTAAKISAAGARPGPLPAAQRRLADALVLGKLRAALGLDELRVAASGAAAIPPETLEFLLGLGFTVTEVWGMSETTGVGTFTDLSAPRPGSVGRALGDLQLRLGDDGELLVRGASVTHGYRGMPEQTAEAIDADGWLHTGDVATLADDGYVTIVDRKKELLITAAGKNISPANVENAVKAASSLPGVVVAVGDGRAYLTALIVLDADVAVLRAKALGMPGADVALLAEHPRIVEEVRAAIRSGNTRLARVEQIKRFTILPRIWEPGGIELTPTLKLRRTPIAAEYATEIDALYTDPQPAEVHSV
ncbi:AMP-dependent synthetase/ligase [Nocardia sp. alder85J]|uniref:AMP-dependent synthetase/ligase n=1 Tax=Nocardia sp. alder85J TaxID=2862949 RepID=UPI001CD3F84A|nr:long-chain fatty acid--CoA ligase [Nocardia sp. alder85J]MCX4092895.1 long-chain fatty acid--CoA ligase [Nocardia sp. alder85J]